MHHALDATHPASEYREGMRELRGAGDAPEHIDQRVILHDVSWAQYEVALKMRGESSGTRIAYLEGELELMTPSYSHEEIKTTIARLLEAYADEREIELTGAGSWTLKKRARKRGAEPDECYLIGPRRKPVPDLVIEVVWTGGGLDKLDIYRGLRIPEVWFWREGAIEVHVLSPDGYARRSRSSVLPKLDLALLARFVPAESQSRAVRAYREALRRSSRP